MINIKSIYFLFLIIVLSKESTDLINLPQYDKIEVYDSDILWLNIHDFKLGEVITLKISWNYNESPYQSKYLTIGVIESYYNNNTVLNYRNVTSKEKEESGNIIYFQFSIKLIKSDNYLIIKLPELARSTKMFVEHTKESRLWILFIVVGIIIFLVIIGIVFYIVKIRTVAKLDKENAPLIPAYQNEYIPPSQFI